MKFLSFWTGSRRKKNSFLFEYWKSISFDAFHLRLSIMCAQLVKKVFGITLLRHPGLFSCKVIIHEGCAFLIVFLRSPSDNSTISRGWGLQQIQESPWTWRSLIHCNQYVMDGYYLYFWWPGGRQMWCLMDLWITDSAPKFYIQGKVFHGDVHEHKIAMS